MIFIIKAIFYLAFAYFMWTDSKNRDSSGILWGIASLFLLFFGFFHLSAFVIFPIFCVLYFLLRPKGELIYCTECFKKKLIDKPYCPHCFHIDESVLEEELENIDDDSSDEKKEESAEEKEEAEEETKEENSEKSEQSQENTDNNDNEKTNSLA